MLVADIVSILELLRSVARRGQSMTDLAQSEVDALLAEAEMLATEVSSASTPQPQPSAPPPEVHKRLPDNLPPELRRILHLEVPVIVQLAERRLDMRDVLQLNVGSVIEFDKPFDAELDLVVTNRKIGLGHAVKVGENFGLRISRIGTIYATIRALGGD